MPGWIICSLPRPACWLRLNWLACMLWMALGKFGRYGLVVSGAGLF